MALFRPASPLVQAWLNWQDAHCNIKGHRAHLRYQCRQSRKIACRGAGLFENPAHPPSKEQATHESMLWVEWQERSCTIEGHGAHLRHQCRESREQALRGCVTSDWPDE